jgi:hypothetical protein
MTYTADIGSSSDPMQYSGRIVSGPSLYDELGRGGAAA